MSEASVTSTAPISGWDPSLRVIVRCLEALNFQNKNLRHDKDRYNSLIESVENYLATQQGNYPGSHALAELAMRSEDDPRFGCQPPARVIAAKPSANFQGAGRIGVCRSL